MNPKAVDRIKQKIRDNLRHTNASTMTVLFHIGLREQEPGSIGRFVDSLGDISEFSPQKVI